MAETDQANVTLATSADSLEWDKYARAHADGTHFHLYGWREVIEGYLGHRSYYLVARRNGLVCGILPLAQVKSALFGNALISTPFLVYGGALVDDPQVETTLASAAMDIGRQADVEHIELRYRGFSGLKWEAREQYVTFRKAIEPTPEANFNAIPRKQRAMVRKGIGAGLETVREYEVGNLHKTLLECKRNLGTPFFEKRFLDKILKTFPDSCEVLTVHLRGQPVCSVMSFRFRNEILPYYGGGGALARSVYGNDFMYWAVMEQACKDGVEIFDFGRSQVGSGAYRFKKHWGFDPEPLRYQYHLVRAASLRNNSPANSRYELAIRLWQRLPLFAARLLGPPLARRLG